MANLQSHIETFNVQSEKALNTFNRTDFWNLSTSLQEFESSLREHIQEVTRDQISEVIKKLENNERLSASDRDYLKLWIVGDAEYYANLENNYQDWVEELKRLKRLITQHSSANLDFESAAKLKAYVLDAIRVIGDIVFFLKQKERITNFVESTADIDPEERKFLIAILQGKKDNPDT